MAKTVVLRGQVILKENSLTEVVGNPILSYDASTGEITSRPAIAAGGAFISTTLPSAQVLVGNGSNVATPVAMTGDIAITNGGVTSIATGVIVNADVNASAAIAYSKLALTGSIVNADVNASAAIARSKTASGTAYRILANNSSGVMSENAALTATRLVGVDANGQLTSSDATVTHATYISTLTSDAQTQISTTIAGHPVDALVITPTASEDGFALTWDDASQDWKLTDPVVQGIPVAGSTRQFLGKNSGTNYDASWLDLLVGDLSDTAVTAADLDIIAGIDANGLTSADLLNLTGTTSNLQNQITQKQDRSLAQNAIWVGNSSNVPAALSAGTNGYVLTISSGVPTWEPSVSGFSNPMTTAGDIIIGDTGGAAIRLGAGTDGQVLTLAAGVPTWSGGGISGLTSPKMPYATAGTTIADSEMYYDSSNIRWGLNISSPSSTLHVARGGATLDTVETVATLRRFTTGTPANGIGAGLSFEVETAGDNYEIGATIEAITTDVTAASEDFYLSIKLMAAGAAAVENASFLASGGFRLGSSGLAGSSRSVFFTGSATDVGANMFVKGAGDFFFSTSSGTSNNALLTVDIGNNTAHYVTLSASAPGGSTTGKGILLVGAQSGDAGHGGHIGLFPGDFGGAGIRGNVSLGGLTLPTWQGMGGGTFIPNALTEPSAAIANGIALYGKDSSDGATNSTLALYLEQAPEATATFTQTHRLKIWINGVEYWLSLDAV
jgi:hypothetical protein